MPGPYVPCGADVRGAPVQPLTSTGQGAREKHTIACGFVAHRIITGGPRRNPVMSDPPRGGGHAIGMLASTIVLEVVIITFAGYGIPIARATVCPFRKVREGFGNERESAVVFPTEFELFSSLSIG